MSKNFELLQQSQEKDLFCTSSNPAEPWVTVVGQQAAVRCKSGAQEAVRGLAMPGQWLNTVQEVVKQWRLRLQVSGNHRERELNAVAREEASKLVQCVFRSANGTSPQAVAFAGVEGDGGCATVCARVGEILAMQASGPVCVVDANFQAPRLHGYFNIRESRGLAEAVLETGPIQDFAQPMPNRNLWVLPGGSAQARLDVSLSDERLDARMKELRSVFHRVVIQFSPLGPGGGALPLSRWTDGVVLVLEAHSTRREAARRVKESLEMADVRMLGVVLNNRTFPIPESLYRRL